jgi:hypothetical protein
MHLETRCVALASLPKVSSRCYCVLPLRALASRKTVTRKEGAGLSATETARIPAMRSCRKLLYREDSGQPMSTSSPGPGVSPDRIRVSPADRSRAMPYRTPPGTSMETPQFRPWQLAGSFLPSGRTPLDVGPWTMIAATWPSVSSVVIRFAARLPGMSICCPRSWCRSHRRCLEQSAA